LVGPDNEPMIRHGKTVTTSIRLRDVLAAIARCAFVASPYPVILSLEMHCSVAQQDKITLFARQVQGYMYLYIFLHIYIYK